jgi:plastocyanin
VQYNVLIGQLNEDLAARGGPANVLTDPHTLAPHQCADCHTPNYAVNAGTNVTGHSFVSDNNGCLASCHSSLTPAQLATKTLNSKMAVSNSMDRVVSLLKQWGMTVAPAILQTNYGTCAWEYPSPLAYFGAKSTNVIGGVTYKFLTGPPKAYSPTFGAVPSGTNDNLQLSTVPQDIRIARFSLYWIYEDQSYGVHNPTYVKSLLADAETRVMNQFISANYLAAFSASATSGTGSLTVTFNNYNLTGSVYSWTFGDGDTTTGSNPTHTYTTPGLYSVTCTVDGNPLTRAKYILVQ